jgi:hypothetical protein
VGIFEGITAPGSPENQDAAEEIYRIALICSLLEDFDSFDKTDA